MGDPMRFTNPAGLLVGFLFSINAFANQVAVDVKLSPAGSFKAETSKVTGSAKKTADGVLAENVVVDVQSLKTGIELRDKHLKDYLKGKEYPQIKLIKATGKGGKGKGVMEIMGMKKEVDGTYEVAGSDLKAQFKMKLSELKITGVKYMGIGVKDEVVIKVNLPLK